MLRQSLRIIGAIAAKDIGDAIRNRMTLSVMVGTLVLMLSSVALPLLTSLDRTPTALVVDPGRTVAVRALTVRDDFRLRLVNSEEAMRNSISGSNQLILGLVIPSGAFDTTDKSAPVSIAGYAPHWAPADKLAALVAFFEAQLGDATGMPVTIDPAGHLLYPSPGVFGGHTMAASSAGMVILVVGLSLSTMLLTEENDTHTLEALLVSPARYGHVIVAKTLTGLFYCSCAAAVVLLASTRWLVHWGLALAAVSLGATFVVILGLLIGSMVGSSFNANLWLAFVALVVLVPGFAGALIGENATPLLRTLLAWVPSGAMNTLLVDSTLGAIGISTWGPPLARLTGGIAVFAALLAWRVHTVEQQG